MNLVLDRFFKGPKYTVGHLYIDGKYFCDTMEDKDRGLLDSMSLAEIKSKKVSSETAIPRGTYKVTLEVVSPKYSKKDFYIKVCNGKVPRLLNVKGFEGILIHTGNTEKDSAGCIILGENKVKGKVINSRVTFEKFYNTLIKSNSKEITITIK